MTATAHFPRFVEPRLLEALGDSPAVLIHGPRQCGKTTLARALGDRDGYRYTTFDDDVARSAAESDPIGFVASLHERSILDEVQRVPALLTSIKHAIDRDRRPGRFLLTGSANVLLIPNLSDSLAGRMEIVHLHPLSQGEMAGREPRFLDQLFAGTFPGRRGSRLGDTLIETIVAGGYPAALQRSTPRRRSAWYRTYVQSLVERDVREISRISSLDALPRLLTAIAAQSAQLLNVTDLSAPFSLSRPTIRDYVTVLQRVFLVDILPPWHSNRLKRLVKTPKVHIGDTGVACALLGVDAAALRDDRTLLGHLLETFVFQELRRQASWHEDAHSFLHFRDKDGVEVDMVIERGAREVTGVEVKLSATVTDADFRALRKLGEAAGRRFKGGVVLYDGDTTAPFGPGMWAVPLGALWETV